MLGKTHFIAEAIAGYSLYPHFSEILVGRLGGLVPDIDEQHSLLGHHLPFISYPLNGIFGHRTLTHSLAFLIAMTLSVMPFSYHLALAFGMGLLSHLLGDMITGKIKLLWPLDVGIGIAIPRITYSLVDGITRLCLVLWVGWYGFHHTRSLSSNVSGSYTAIYQHLYLFLNQVIHHTK
jgi:inner membrane protein